MTRLELLLALLGACTLEAAIFTPEQEADIQSYVEKVLECRNIPGLSLAVVKGEKSWTRGFGFEDLETEQPVKNTTRFLVGSLTKSITMTLLGHYLEIRRLNWDTKLVDIKPTRSYQLEQFEFQDTDTTNQVTVADLLTHQTGVAAAGDYGLIAGYPEGTTRSDLARKIRYIPQKYKFRERFYYNSMMYVVLGHLTEILGQRSWEKLMMSNLFDQIGMTSSLIIQNSDEVHQRGFAKPYILRNGKLEPGTRGIYNITPGEPTGGIVSNGLDMIKWMRFNLQNGETDRRRQLLKPEMMEQAFKEQLKFSDAMVKDYSFRTPIFPVDDVITGFGYAWYTSTYRGYRRLLTNGNLFSYTASIWMFPEKNISMFASINGPQFPGMDIFIKTVLWYLSDMLLGETPWLNIDTACSFPKPWFTPPTFNIPAPPVYENEYLADYVGNYISDLLPAVVIAFKQDGSPKPALRFEMGRITGDLWPTSTSIQLDFEVTEPWELAIQHVVSDTFTKRYPVFFQISDRNVTSGFVMFTDVGVSVPFRKTSI
ncbi:hypothetical protein DPMN_053879 [Dreissena polymorpha]|uniref:Beta-lactamase-related domain-containing protein n=1 Tax=Dreissena polymorpha TaxID=45954 RepID=A0A9D4HSL8_DREPO|nr:hypothetical protein DPMN_053879 [Dreissena polymorpha]